MSGSGESRIEVGGITQSTTKGSAMESALGKSLNSQAAPNPKESDPKKGKKKK